MRINFLGGPDAGKTTTAADVFSRLKRLRVSVEYVNEYVKAWAYEGRNIDAYDQFYLQAKQMHYEYRFLKHGVKNIVTDSPVCLGYIYAPPSLTPVLRQISDTYDKGFAHVNIYLDRGDKPYDPHGRYQDRERAVEVDKKILAEVPNLIKIPWDDIDQIMTIVLSSIKR